MILFTEQEIKNKVGEIAYNLKKRQHDFPPVFIGVLNGAFMFFTDLVKQVGDCEIDFVSAKSYDGTKQGEIRILKSITVDIEGKDVYLIDDIYDSGKTLKYLIKHLSKHEPKKVIPVALFKRIGSDHPDLIYGIELAEGSFVYGYGLDDSKGFNRNLPFTLEE